MGSESTRIDSVVEHEAGLFAWLQGIRDTGVRGVVRTLLLVLAVGLLPIHSVAQTDPGGAQTGDTQANETQANETQSSETQSSDTQGSDTQTGSSQEQELPLLSLLATQVLPAAPTADALCKLRVMIENNGERAVSALRFRVVLDGVPLSVYDRQLFVETVPPGEVSRIELFNFWTSEADRRPPADGTLEVEVTLEAARYLLRDVADDGTEILTLQEAVPGLPTSFTLSVPIAQGG